MAERQPTALEDVMQDCIGEGHYTMTLDVGSDATRIVQAIDSMGQNVCKALALCTDQLIFELKQHRAPPKSSKRRKS